MTQEQLGKELGGWTKKAVSAAERSWEGTRVRQFDADLIADLAAIFRVPVPALYLPPASDGETAVYAIDGENGPVPMDEYFSLLMPEPDFEAASPAGAAYKEAIIAATARYVGSEAGAEVADAIAEFATAAQIEEALREARDARKLITGMYELADRLLAQNELLQAGLERALRRGATRHESHDDS
jgi:hypothetical protein